MTFENDCANCCFYARKTDAKRKKNFAFRSAKIALKFCEWKPYVKLSLSKNDILVFLSQIDNFRLQFIYI